MRVIGLDLSLTSTGMSDGKTSRVVQTDAAECLEQRLRSILDDVTAFVQDADLAVIEAPAWSRASQPGHEELSGLRVMVRCRLWSLGIPYALVPPSTLKLYTTGSGKASKSQMLAAVDNRHDAGLASVLVKDGRYDMADALALAAMGYDHVGQPMKAVTQIVADIDLVMQLPHRDSLSAVKWPELPSDD